MKRAVPWADVTRPGGEGMVRVRRKEPDPAAGGRGEVNLPSLADSLAAARAPPLLFPALGSPRSRGVG
jgi:hypothetical protein